MKFLQRRHNPLLKSCRYQYFSSLSSSFSSPTIFLLLLSSFYTVLPLYFAPLLPLYLFRFIHHSKFPISKHFCTLPTYAFLSIPLSLLFTLALFSFFLSIHSYSFFVLTLFCTNSLFLVYPDVLHATVLSVQRCTHPESWRYSTLQALPNNYFSSSTRCLMPLFFFNFCLTCSPDYFPSISTHASYVCFSLTCPY